MQKDVEEKLKKYARFETEQDIAKFDELLSQISEKRDPKFIPVLMEIFDDNTEFPEVMYTVVHALEYYPDEVHAKAVIESIPFMLSHAPNWLLRLIYAIFNARSSLTLFKKYMHLIPKEPMFKLLGLVAQESPNHRKLCLELKKELLQEAKQ